MEVCDGTCSDLAVVSAAAKPGNGLYFALFSFYTRTIFIASFYFPSLATADVKRKCPNKINPINKNII
jgi:hypothetical protein